MTSADIIVKISNLKDEVESKQKEIKSLEEELREIGMKEAARIIKERKERAERMAKFIQHNSARTLVVEMTVPEFNGEEYLGEVKKEFTLKPGEYVLSKAEGKDWCIDQPKVFGSLLEYIDNIHVLFE